MPNQKPKVYKGDLGYVFVSYAHEDSKDVLPIVHALVAEGCRVWYDDGIELATDYPSYIADHVHECAMFMMFISNNYNASKWCHVEASYALHLNKAVLPVYLEDVELERGLQMRLIDRQSMSRTAFPSRDEFCRVLLRAEALRACRASEGDGVQATLPQATNKRREHENLADAGGVARRPALAEYSWTELKMLSQAIAATVSDADGMAIAKSYGLVDKEGKLRGDRKPIKLKDGTNTYLRILGFRHDELAGGGKAGISLEFADVPAAHWMNSDWTNKGGWEKSEMRTWLNGEFLAKLPDDLRSLVESVSKRTNNVGEVNCENDTSVVSPTNDKLWLLSLSEVYGRMSNQTKNAPWSPETYFSEGAQYQFYENEGVSTDGYGSCKKRGASSWWWLRSPNAGGSWRFRVVQAAGNLNRIGAGGIGGVSPGFCL